MSVEPDSIDQAAAESLLSGSPRPDEAPALRRVRALLGAAARPSPTPFTSRDDLTIARMLDVIEHTDGTPARAMVSRSRRLSLISIPQGSLLLRRRLLKTKLVGAIAAMTLLAGTGLAFAGVLPGGLQDTASHLLRRVGIHVPEGARSDQLPVGRPGDQDGTQWIGPVPRGLSRPSVTPPAGERGPVESSGPNQGDQGDQNDPASGGGSGEQGDGSSGSSGGGGDQGRPGAGTGSGSGGQDSGGGGGQG